MGSRARWTARFSVDVLVNSKLQNPNSKRTPNAKGTPNHKVQTSQVRSEFWRLRFGVPLEFEIWSLELSLLRSAPDGAEHDAAEGGVAEQPQGRRPGPVEVGCLFHQGA